MTISLETTRTAAGIEYRHSQLGHIATKVFHPESCWGLVPADGRPAEVCRRLFGSTAGIGCETVDWLALALAAQLIEEMEDERERGAAVACQEEEAEPATRWNNHYTCERCGHDWQDEWDCQVDDDCPKCGARHMSPHTSEEVTA